MPKFEQMSTDSNANPKKEDALSKLLSEREAQITKEKTEEQQTQEQEKMTKEQKRAEAEKALLPLNAELRKTEKEKVFNYGGRLYSTLQKNREGFAQWLKGSIDVEIKRDNISSEMNKKYNEITGENLGMPEGGMSKEQMYEMHCLVEPDYESKIPPTRERVDKFMRERKIEEMKRDFRMKREEKLNERMRLVPGEIGRYTFAECPKTSEELIVAIENSKNREAPEYTEGQEKWVENHNSLLQGLGIAALESGDIKVAAKALAISQAEKAPLEISERFQQGLSGLDSDKQLEFIQAFKSPQEKPEKEE